MKLTLGDTTYQSELLSLYDLSIGEARTIKRNTGLTLADWRFHLVTYFREDPDMLAGLVWVLKHRAGEVVDWAEIDEVKTQELAKGFTYEESDAEELARLQPDDTESGADPESERTEGQDEAAPLVEAADMSVTSPKAAERNPTE